jgi:hypothetical protein
MSESVREEITSAANKVDGVNVTPYFRQVTRPGQGMVRKGRVDYPNTFGGVVTWQVWILLPQDLASAEKWLDETGAALTAAVSEAMVVRSLTPIIAPDLGSLPAVVIEGTREED